LLKKFFWGALILFFVSSSAIQAQRQNALFRYLGGLLNDTTDVSRPRFLIYPTVAYAPETSWEFGLSSLYVYHAGRDTTNRLSEINGFTFVTLERQYGLLLDHALYSDGDKWFLLGSFRFQSFPLLYYGIGPQTPPEYQARVDAIQLQFTERALRKVYRNLFAGVEVDFQSLSSVNFVTPSADPIVEPSGSRGSTNLGLGLGVIYDNRHNVLNVRDGMFSELSVFRYAPAWGSDFTFTRLISDTRIYRPVNDRDVVAAQVLGQFNLGDVPFNQLALMGGENMMRGYYLGRYRDKNMVTAQAEYRFLPLPLGFTKRIGAAVFGSTGTVFNDFSNLTPRNLVWAGGGGLRFLLFPKRDIYTRLDVAFTSEGTGLYIFVGESF
jgi:hypothetical protein